jgi:phage-related protein
MDIEILSTGKEFSLYGIINQGKSLIREFLEGLDKNNKAQMTALLQTILDHGPPRNEEKFRNLGDGIYELKAREGARVLCFWAKHPRRSLILTHGFPKCKPKQLKVEKEKALAWYKEYQKSL